MLDGITVLAQEEITKSSTGTIIFCAIAAFALMVALCALYVNTIGTGSDFECTACTAISVLVALLVAYIAAESTAEPTGRYRYECLIDDDVSVVEFDERYTIIDKRGDIWSIEDKENINE